MKITKTYFWLNEIAVLLRGRKPDKSKSQNPLKLSFAICEAFIIIHLVKHLSLNQTPLVFWLYMRQTGRLNGFLGYLCEEIFSFNWKGNCYSYAWFCNLCEGGTSFSTGLILRKLLRFLSLDSYSYFQLTFSPMKILIMLLSQFLLAFLQTRKVFSFSFHIFWLYSCWMTDLRDPLTNVSCNNIFNLYASATAASL